MSEPSSTAKSARERLARALEALQSDPAIPPQLLAAAEPVSQAMGALFQIERAGVGALPQQAPAALEAVRRALALLQTAPSTHPAVEAALAAVAGSLGLVHGLTQAAPAPAAPAYAPPQAAPAYAPPQAVAAPLPAQPRAVHPHAATQASPGLAGAAQGPLYRPEGAPASNRQGRGGAAPAGSAPKSSGASSATGAVRMEAELGAQSPSNFYKGLSGNDVIEHGGLFVATYNIPSLGQSVALRVSLPGGYEFEALATVRWVRELDSSAGGGEAAQPGFGAQFTHITPEARQLVYRYVRNREPLFHDDL